MVAFAARVAAGSGLACDAGMSGLERDALAACGMLLLINMLNVLKSIQAPGRRAYARASTRVSCACADAGPPLACPRRRGSDFAVGVAAAVGGTRRGPNVTRGCGHKAVHKMLHLSAHTTARRRLRQGPRLGYLALLSLRPASLRLKTKKGRGSGENRINQGVKRALVQTVIYRPRSTVAASGLRLRQDSTSADRGNSNGQCQPQGQHRANTRRGLVRALRALLRACIVVHACIIVHARAWRRRRQGVGLLFHLRPVSR